MIVVTKVDVDGLASEHDQESAKNRVEVNNTPVSKDGLSSGTEETVTTNENEDPVGKTRDELNDTVSNGDLSSGDVEKDKVNLNNTSDDKDSLSIAGVKIVSDSGKEDLLENKVENFTSETENIENYHTNALPEGDQQSIVQECAKIEVETKLEENSGTKETHDGKVITKSDEVDSYCKNRESPVQISFYKSEPSVENRVAKSIAGIKSVGKVETSVSDSASIQFRRKNPEFVEGYGLVTGKFTSTETNVELVTIGKAVIEEVVVKDVDNTSLTKDNVYLDKFVSETNFACSDNDKSHKSIDEAEIEAEGNQEPGKIPANKHIETVVR